ncbi:hypothetical protein SESBI_28807 [Sesbania bispinosa]|nr:hypothetical protein SESBI_28807 [Sesbania bispinosa]
MARRASSSSCRRTISPVIVSRRICSFSNSLHNASLAPLPTGIWKTLDEGNMLAKPPAPDDLLYGWHSDRIKAAARRWLFLYC